MYHNISEIKKRQCRHRRQCIKQILDQSCYMEMRMTNLVIWKLVLSTERTQRDQDASNKHEDTIHRKNRIRDDTNELKMESTVKKYNKCFMCSGWLLECLIAGL